MNEEAVLSMMQREKRMHSSFRPPTFYKAAHPAKKALTATASPWYPAQMKEAKSSALAPLLAPPAALGLSPDMKPAKKGLPPALSVLDSTPLSPQHSSPFSPLSTPITTFFHNFTESASAEQVYPAEMMLSTRRDASHTPHGVLKWCVQQYFENPMLKMPSHLQLSVHEVVQPKDGVTRGALGSGLKSKTRSKPVRQTHHKVMSVLSRITPEKYDALLEELLQLPLRQTDENELQEVVKVFFDKAIQEPEYSELYSHLVSELCTMKEQERELEVELQERLLCTRMRRLLILCCQEEFRRPIELSADDKVDRTTGKPLNEEETEMKRIRMKNRVVGNIKFVGELYKMDLVTERVIEDILHLLVGTYDPENAQAREDYVFEVFITLIKTVGDLLKIQRPHILQHYLAVARVVESTHPSNRIRYLTMDLTDLNRRKQWISLDHVAMELENMGASQYVSKAANGKGHNAPAPSRATATAPTAAPTTGVTPTSSQSRVPQPRRMAGSPTSAIQLNEVLTPISATPTSAQTQRNSTSMNSFISTTPSFNQNGSPKQPLDTPTTGTSNKSNGNTMSFLQSRDSFANTSSGSINGIGGTPVSTNIVPNDEPSASQARGGGGNAHASNGASFSKGPGHAQVSLATVTESAQKSVNLPAALQRNLSTPNASYHAGMDRRMSNATPSFSLDNGMDGTSDGMRTPFSRTHGSAAHSSTGDTVNIQDVAMQLMQAFNHAEEELNVAKCFHDLALKNKVLCLTWWLRQVSTKTDLFDERQRVPVLLSVLLTSCPSFSPQDLKEAILQWVQFDIERAEYDQCPRMFDNIAHIIQYAYSSEAGKIKNIAAVREILHVGIFNVMLHALTTDHGTDQMVTFAKCAYHSSALVMQSMAEPATMEEALRLAADNRFRILPYFLCVSARTDADLPGTPTMRPRTPSTPTLRNSPLSDSITTTGHYDPLAQCFTLPRVMDDAELAVYRRIRGGVEGSAWRDDVLKIAFTPCGNDTLVTRILQVMKVVGALFNSTTVSVHGSNILTLHDVDSVVRGILEHFPEPVFRAAVVLEAIMHFTQALNGEAGTARKSARIKPLRQVLSRWCSQELMDKSDVLAMVRTLETTSHTPPASLYPLYHNAIADADIPWEGLMTCLG